MKIVEYVSPDPELVLDELEECIAQATGVGETNATPSSTGWGTGDGGTWNGDAQ